jgi:hypothetical protein
MSWSHDDDDDDDDENLYKQVTIYVYICKYT